MKNILILVLFTGCIMLGFVAWHNTKPICHELIQDREKGVICEYYLGEQQLTDAKNKVIMVR